MVQPGRVDYDVLISFLGQGPLPESAQRRVHASFISSTIMSDFRAYRVPGRASIGASPTL